MNYRHVFHAGNFADVFKHVILLELVDLMKIKDTPFAIIDTHAGEGIYDITGADAMRTGEAKEGVLKLFSKKSILPPAVVKYLSLVETIGGKEALYPGSPLLVASQLRSKDRLVAFETDSVAVTRLKECLAPFKQAQVFKKDGYTAADTSYPMHEGRGLTLIDPPFEDGEDFVRIKIFLKKALKRFNNGVFAIWFAIKSLPTVHLFYDQLLEVLEQKAISLEFFYHQPDNPLKFNGCGMIIINTPTDFDKRLDGWMPALIKALGTNDSTWQRVVLKN